MTKIPFRSIVLIGFAFTSFVTALLTVFFTYRAFYYYEVIRPTIGVRSRDWQFSLLPTPIQGRILHRLDAQAGMLQFNNRPCELAGRPNWIWQCPGAPFDRVEYSDRQLCGISPPSECNSRIEEVILNRDHVFSIFQSRDRNAQYLTIFNHLSYIASGPVRYFYRQGDLYVVTESESIRQVHIFLASGARIRLIFWPENPRAVQSFLEHFALRNGVNTTHN